MIDKYESAEEVLLWTAMLASSSGLVADVAAFLRTDRKIWDVRREYLKRCAPTNAVRALDQYKIYVVPEGGITSETFKYPNNHPSYFDIWVPESGKRVTVSYEWGSFWESLTLEIRTHTWDTEPCYRVVQYRKCDEEFDPEVDLDLTQKELFGMDGEWAKLPKESQTYIREFVEKLLDDDDDDDDNDDE